jgi:hypothetical protein
MCIPAAFSTSDSVCRDVKPWPGSSTSRWRAVPAWHGAGVLEARFVAGLRLVDLREVG